jgi:glycosyltransferase involved in cell wall biosynthesis
MEVVPLVSVFCPTYNHEKYIRKCLDGFISQNTNFQIEVIVQDDASTDNTSSIIKEYSDNYPFIIHHLHEFNIFSLGKNLNEYFYKNARGKYLAMCEGDDYWTDPYKLQKQVDFLESNPEYAICFHRANLKVENDIQINDQYVGPEEEKDLLIEDFILSNPVPTVSAMFKNVLHENFEDWESKMPFGDLLIYTKVLKITNLKAKYIPDVMATYRIHNGGIHSGSFTADKVKTFEKHLQHVKLIKEHLLKKSYRKQTTHAIIYFIRKCIRYTPKKKLFKQFKLRCMLVLYKLKFHILYNDKS